MTRISSEFPKLFMNTVRTLFMNSFEKCSTRTCARAVEHTKTLFNRARGTLYKRVLEEEL
jgi:hypothetical protein